MGSSKKHKDKSKEKSREEKKHKSKDESGRKRKHRSRSKSLSTSPPPVVKEKSRKRKKEKRRHESESEDSDAPIAKSSKSDAYKNRSPSPITQKGDGSVLSIEETNKLRAKLGLKPLQVEDASKQKPKAVKHPELEEGEEVDDEFDEETLRKIREEREKEGDTFWKETKDFVHAPAENITQKLQAEKIRNKISTMKEKRKLENKMLEAKGIADSDDDDDVAGWVLKQKRAAEEKALAEKRARELDELDQEFGLGEVVETEFVKHRNKAYTERDIQGMKVLHDQSRIGEGEQVILTLQDKGVLDEEEDKLVNVNLLDDERFAKNVENKNIRPELHGYNAFDEVEFDDQGNLKTKSLLGKYDEEISGPQKQSFVIGQDLSEETRKARIREKMQRKDKILESLEGSSMKIASDYYTPDEMVSFKKPKRKVKKLRKSSLKADDILRLSGDSAKHGKDLGSRKKDHSEMGQLKNEPADMEIDLEIDDLPTSTEVDISDVKLEDEADIDFQRALDKARKLKQTDKKVKAKPKQNIADLILQDKQNEESSGGGSIVLHATAEFCRTLGDIPGVESANDLYGDEEMDFEQEESHTTGPAERGSWNEVSIDETPVDVNRPLQPENVPILEQEPDIDVGVTGALKLAQRKGYLEQQKAKRLNASTMRHLQAQHYTIEDKNYEDDRVSKRDMYSGPTSEFRDKEGYKPEVKLEYNDEEGKPISAKEAFRLLSHKFHGKSSGKNKLDKKRKKIEQEKLLQHMNSADTPLGTLELLQQRQKDTHSAYLVLSGSKAHTLTKTKR